MRDHIRQGDVLVIDADEIPGEAKKADEKGRIVLAHGEATGHAHAIYDRGATLHRAPDNKGTFLRLIKTVALSHEEHTKIPLDKGVKRVIRQSEYSPEELRYVAD